MKERLVIIGGNGFIGSNADRHFGEYYEVSVLDRKPSLHNHNSGNRNYLLDIQNNEKLMNILCEIDPHYVLNLASQSTVSVCLEFPREAYLDNVLGNLNVLTACLSLQERKGAAFKKLLVHTSDKVYGDQPETEMPLTENNPFYPSDIYSSTKVAQDMMTMSWCRCNGLSASVVRSGNIYGPGDMQFSRLVPGTMKCLLEGKQPVLYTDSDKMVREFVYIDDLLSAYSVIFKQGQAGEAYNVGGSGATRVVDVVQIMKELTGCQEMDNSYVSREFHEIMIQHLDCRKLKELGWNPRVSLRHGIARSVEFYSEILPHKQDLKT